MYRDLSHPAPCRASACKNFDDPNLLESSLLAEHIDALARGDVVTRPLYDFSTYTRVPGQTESVRARAVLLVEGLFALHYPELLPLYHLRVYVDTPEDICFERNPTRCWER